MYVTYPSKQPSYPECDAVLIVPLDMGLAIMYKPTFITESNLPLEIRGYEVNTAQDVFVLTRALDVNLELSLEANGHVQRANIVLSHGQIVGGWVKV
jgi:hypothetical protein